MKSSSKFEHQIRRIHELIEQSGSTVTWNARISDPDNPTQPRQIDITVRAKDQFTLIECRIHDKPQDVTWIEELIGRRLSLRADGVIAVSASGFTEGAIRKAKEFGIVLRDILSLSKNEILSWGKSTKVNLIFYEFKNISITFKAPTNYVGPSFVENIIRNLENDAINLYDLFNSIANRMEFKNLKEKGITAKVDLSLKKEFLVENVTIKDIVFESEVSLLYKEVTVPSVHIYGSPNDTVLKRNVAIERVGLGNSEITQAEDEVTIALDLSAIESPQNCLFRIVDLEFRKTVHFNKIEILGLPKMKMFLSQFSIGVQLLS